jgi:hypothetical protein
VSFWSVREGLALFGGKGEGPRAAY